MKYFWLTATVLFFSFFGSPAQAVKWPMLADLTFIPCTTYLCGNDGNYTTSGTTIMVSAPDGVDTSSNSYAVWAYGLHCSDWDSGKNSYSSCYWLQGNERTNGHAPRLTGICETTEWESFEIIDESQCKALSGIIGGSHKDNMPIWAGRGEGALKAECVLFGKGRYSDRRLKVIATPWGPMDADVIANSNSGYCMKPGVPFEKCTLKAVGSAIIDHGTVPSTGESTRTLQFQQDCGKSTQVTVLGNGKLEMGDGVSTTLSILNKTASGFTLESRLSTVNASAGAYQASIVVMVSPQ